MNSIVESIYCNSLKYPDKPCIIDQEQKITYSCFFDLIKKYAYVLKNIYKISSKEYVLVENNQKISYFAIEFALHLIGAIFIPLETKCSDLKIKDINNKCKSKLIILNNKRFLDDFRYVIYSDIESSMDKMYEEYEFPKDDSIGEVLFSTGTTGKEKGIVLTHKSDVAVAENIIYGVSMKADNIEIIPLPINHSHGLRSCYANFYNGSTVILLESITNISFLQESLDTYKANSIDLVPSALSILLKLSMNMLSNYSNQIRYIEFGSAALLESDKKRIQELLSNSNLYNFYGSTESGRTLVYNFKKGNEKEKCIGKPTHNVKLVILDENNNIIESSPDKVGRIATSGPMNMLCYFEDREETNKVFVNKYVVSSDLAYIDLDGDVILLGRDGDVINIGGKKVSPEEIENIVKQIKGVEDCACIPIKDDILGQVPKLYVQIKKNSLDNKAIKDYLTNKLERFKMPKQIEIIDKIPRTFNGKIDKKLLK